MSWCKHSYCCQYWLVSIVSILTYSYSKKHSKPASPVAYILLLLHLLCNDSKAGIPLFAKNVMGISMWAVLLIQFSVILVLTGSRFLTNDSRSKQN